MTAAQQLAREQREADRDDQLDGAAAAERRLAVLALAHVHRHLDQPELGVGDADERLDLRRLAHVVVGEQRERVAVDRVQPARAVGDRLAEPQAHEQPQQRRADDPLRRGLVALAVAAGVRQEARADRDVALARAHELEHPGELGGGMLAVGVEPPAVVVAAHERLAIALGDPRAQPAVLAERHDVRPAGARHRRRCRRSSRRRSTSRSTSGSEPCASASTSGSERSSFHAGMNTSVPAIGRHTTPRARVMAERGETEGGQLRLVMGALMLVDAAGLARPDDRLDRAADDRRRPRRARAHLLGRDRVPAGDHGRHAALRQARRSVRAQGRAAGRARDLPDRLGAVRAWRRG